jgi:2-polyprenyl-3-methyl-5-hydroxy-6-metoxy-1,4-benzoquinol methylase
LKNSLARRALVATYNRWLAFRASREHSVKVIARSNDRRAFERIYGSADLRAEYLGPDRLAFYDEIATICSALDPRTVIDVGCGTGHLLAAVARQCPDARRLVGVDYAFAAIEQLQQVLPEAQGVVSSVYDLDFGKERFDLVLCTEVLEHLEDPSRALGILRSLCSSDGRLVVTVPDGERDTYEGHVNFWSQIAFENVLSQVGHPRVTRSREGDLVGVVSV